MVKNFKSLRVIWFWKWAKIANPKFCPDFHVLGIFNYQNFYFINQVNEIKKQTIFDLMNEIGDENVIAAKMELILYG